MKTAKIIKGIGGFYYVNTEEYGIVECKAIGKFRNQHIKPMVGDDVSITITDEHNLKGVIDEIYPRHSQLVRPFISNVDSAMIVVAASKPDPNLFLLDKFLIMLLQQGIKPFICINKKDLVTEDELKSIVEPYEAAGYEVITVSGKFDSDIENVKEKLKSKTTVIAGTSGVGKSTIINRLQSSVVMETGEISKKLKKGKHTTRHSELICVDNETYIMDTPGFSSLEVEFNDVWEIRKFYPEFEEAEKECDFGDCLHINEPRCGVKNAVKKDPRFLCRYENYKLMVDEFKGRRIDYRHE